MRSACISMVFSGSGDNNNQLIQHHALEAAKCTRCKKHLSIFPITRNLQNEVLCGRCHSDLPEDTLLEGILNCMKFPCIHRQKGCLEVFTPSSMAVHELRCKYRIHQCPTRVFNNCLWEGTINDLLAHFEEIHPTFIIHDKFEVDFVNNHSENYVMKFGDEIFVVTREANSNEQWFAITVNYLGVNRDMESYSVKVILESGGGTKEEKYSQLDKLGVPLKVHWDKLQEVLDDPLTIVASVEVQPSQDNVVVDDSDLDFENLREVECPVCMRHMVPPIFQCDTGHSICEGCKLTQSCCPTCKGTFQNVRNFTLERIVVKMIYPCENREAGCVFKDNARNIRKHELTCMFGPFDCPLQEYENCSYTCIASQLHKHISTKHYENLLELDTISMPFVHSIKEDIVEAYIMRFGEKLFRVCFKFEEEEMKFMWSVQYIGPAEESPNYVFELEILPSSSTLANNCRLYLKSTVIPIASKEDTFGNGANHVYFSFDQISGFVKNQLTYRVLISNKL